jgi:phospholipid/cholesterol/gamma-HCH transport system ATP-binding protein
MVDHDSDRRPVIRVERVSKRYGDAVVLRDVSFEVAPHETVCILGGSGGGKSTLLKVMIGAVAPTAGRVWLGSDELTGCSGQRLDRLRRRMGVMFQSGALLNSMTVAQNIALPLQYHSALPGELIDTVVKIKLNQVDLLHAADLRPSELSGGMQKRAAVARALALDPEILFYDEPSAGLDPIATTRLDQLINELKTSMGMTSVVVTHVMESVRRIADHVIMLDQGTVILDAPLAELENSEDPRIRQFRSGDVDGPAEGAVSRAAFLRDLLM